MSHYYNSNININLLEFGPQFEKFIYTVSSESTDFNVPFKETDLPFPISPYAVATW